MAADAAGPLRSAPPSPSPQAALLLPALSLLVWGALSSSIIMTNKRVYSGGFPYPCALTCIGSGFSALAALVVARAAAAWACGRAASGGGGSNGNGPALPDVLRMRGPREVYGEAWWLRGQGSKQQQQRQQQQQQQRRSPRRPGDPAAAAAASSAATPSLLSWVLPVAVATALSMALGNVPYLYLSVSLIQMLKASSPAWTLLLAAAAGLETPTAALAGAVGLIAAGTAATVLFQEGGAAHVASSSSSSSAAAAAPSSNAAFGMALTLLSCVTEAARVVGSQALLQKAQKKQRRQKEEGEGHEEEQDEQERPRRGGVGNAPRAQPPPPPQPLNALESLAYVGAPASLLLLLASLALREGGSPRGLLLAARAFASARPRTALAAVASSAAVNLASAAAIHLTSSLTFKVVGCAKNAAVMAMAAAEHGDRVTPGQAAGYALATSGFVAYAWIKARGQGQRGGGAGAGGRVGRSDDVGDRAAAGRWKKKG